MDFKINKIALYNEMLVFGRYKFKEASFEYN